ncbi:MAG: GspE/PulE family protein [Clostridia bacterium]|nr:GspE/PulE family protein [Clostridia bacterium]
MEKTKRPLGVELLTRGYISENDIDNVLTYQKKHPELQFGEILYILQLCSANKLLEVLSDKTGYPSILITKTTLKIAPTKFFSIDYIKKNKVLPFEINKEKGIVKVAFANIDDEKIEDEIIKILAKSDLILEKYITLGVLIDESINVQQIDRNMIIPIDGDVSKTVDKIIKTSMEKRASDIHFEPFSDGIRVRIRIDGELIVLGVIEKMYMSQVIGRIKSISNMYQEKQESQDGRIASYPDYNIRVSSQKNIYGDKIVLRLLKKNATISEISDLGYPDDDEFLHRYFGRVNGITIITAPTGEGKTTTLYSIISKLNNPNINITTIEDPVEIRIEGLNQIEVNDNITFFDSLRTVLRQDPEIILVGEIRDSETAQMAISAAHTGHYVLTTLHAISAAEAITRLRKLGLSDYDISGAVNTIVSQRLVRRFCTCAEPRPFSLEEKKIIKRVEEKYNVKFDIEGKTTYSLVGCDKCNGVGYYERIAIYELIEFTDTIRDMLNRDASVGDIKKQILVEGFKPIQVDAIEKIIKGITSFSEVEKKINLNM